MEGLSSCGDLYPALIKSKKRSHLAAMYMSLVPAMILGRIAGGAAKALFITIGVIGSSSPYTFAAFFSGYFASTAVGAVIHLILVPAVVFAIESAGLSPVSGGKR